MQDQERSILWIVRCITILIIVRKQLRKPLRQATVEDLRSLLHWIDNKGYKASSNEKFRKVLKFFFKVVYGNNKYYPEQVEWIYTRVSKEKAGKQMSMDMAEYLEEEEGLIDGLNRVVISRRRYSPPVIGLEGGMAIGATSVPPIGCGMVSSKDTCLSDDVFSDISKLSKPSIAFR